MLSSVRYSSVLTKRCSICLQKSQLNFPSDGHINQVRQKHVRIGKPRRATWERQKLLALSKPSWPEEEPLEDIWKNCQYVLKEAERKEYTEGINKLEEFYVKEMVENFERSKMIAFFYSHPISTRNFHAAWQNSRRLGMDLQKYHRRVGKAGLTGTRWQNCLHFWFSFQGDMNMQPVLFSSELDAAGVVKFEKKVPEFTLIGCVFDDRILSRKQMHELVKLPSVDESRAQLVSLLSHNQQRTISLLQSNQQQLTTNLSQLIKDNSSDLPASDNCSNNS